MKLLAFALVVVAPLWACAVDEAPDNQAEARVDNAVDVAQADGIQPLPDQPGGDGAATAPDDVRVKGERAGPFLAEEADQCGASRYQWLVGRQRSDIPPEPQGARWRIACTGCPITMDYSPSRLNIFYDQETEWVEEVRCG